MSIKDSKKQAKRKKNKKMHEDFLFSTYNKYGKLTLKQDPPHGARYISSLFEKKEKSDE